MENLIKSYSLPASKNILTVLKSIEKYIFQISSIAY